MTASIVEVIQHYQRSIDNSQDNEARVSCVKTLTAKEISRKSLPYGENID